jgi:hypothetical protein
MILTCFLLFIALVYSSTQSLQPGNSKFSLEELEEKILSKQKGGVKFQVCIRIAMLLEVPPKQY